MKPSHRPAKAEGRREAVAAPGHFARAWDRFGPVCCFSVAWLFLWLRVDPALLYYARPPMSPEPSAPSAWLRPGGSVEAAARWLSTWQQWPAGGALVFAGLLAGLFALNRRLLAVFPLPAAGSLALGPAGFLLVLGGCYGYPWLETALGMLAAVGAALAYRFVPMSQPWVRLPVFWALTAATGLLAGLVPGVWFALVCAGLEVTVWRRRPLGFLCLASGAFVVGCYLNGFALPPKAFLAWWSPDRAGYVTAGFYLCGPASVAVLAALLAAANRSAGSVGRGEGGGAGRFSLGLSWGRWAQGVLALVFLGVAYGGVDETRRAALRVNDHAGREEWDAVLAAAPRAGRTSGAVRLNVARALYHRGALLDSLFRYPQSVEVGLLPGPQRGLELLRALGGVLLDLGQVNLAEHWASEAIEDLGEQPDVLRLLYRINLVKDKPTAARAFLSVLRQNPRYHGEADGWLRRIDTDPSWANDPQVSRWRAVRVRQDNPSSTTATGEILRQALESNPTHRMAFEYLLAHYLLSLKPEGIVRSIPRFDDFGVTQLPRHVEEALMAYQQETFAKTGKVPPLDLRGRTLRPETTQRFDRFVAALGAFKGNVAAARATLAREFGDTYWYFSIYEESDPPASGSPNAP